MVDLKTDLKEGTALRSDYYRIRRWIQDDDKDSHGLLDTLFERLVAKNSGNLEAMLPVRDVELNPLQYDNDTMVYGEDYEVGCFYTHPDTQEQVYDIQAKKDELGDEIDELNAEINELDTDEELTEKYKEILKEKKHKRDELEEELAGWERAEDDPEYEEIYWNTMWRPEGEMDAELARRLGFGVLTFLKGPHEGEEFMFLQGCGMDLTPKIVAYNALKYGCVDPGHTHYFTREPSYTIHVMHTDIFEEVVTRLGVKELAYETLAKDEQRAKEMNERQAKYHAERERLYQEAEEDKKLPYKLFKVTGKGIVSEDEKVDFCTARSARAVHKYQSIHMMPGFVIEEVPGGNPAETYEFVDTDGSELTRDEYEETLEKGKDY